MKCLRLLILLGLGAMSSAWGQDYLADDEEPAVEASRLATPFTPPPGTKADGHLGGLSRDPFVRDATFAVRPRFYYRSVRNALGVQDTFAGGGSVGLTTGWWRDFLQFGATGWTTQPLVAVGSDNRSGLVEPDGQGFFTLGEAWGRARVGWATGTFYRQTLDLPFLNRNDSRMIPNTFEAYQVDARPWDWLRINAGYVARMKGRDTPDFDSMSQVAGASQGDRGTTFAGFVLGEEDATYLEAMGELTADVLGCTYAQAGHTWRVGPEFELRADAQFADQRSVGAEWLGGFATQLYGARLAASYGGALLALEYTGVADGAGLRNPFGGSPAFNASMIANFDRAGQQAGGVGLTYDFGRVGLRGVTAFASCVESALPGDGWQREVNVTADYRIDAGWLRNLWLRARYAHNESSFAGVTEDFRVILNYAITF